jgi:Pectate lyase superfamily protein
MIDPRVQIASRRRLLSLGCAGGMMNLLAVPSIAQPPESKGSPVLIPESKSVMSFGARGDGSTDDTAAFQRALDSVHKAGGGTVYAPPGRYLFRDTLDVPDGVSLRGSYLCVPSHTGIRDKGQIKPGEDGTALRFSH